MCSQADARQTFFQKNYMQSCRPPMPTPNQTPLARWSHIGEAGRAPHQEGRIVGEDTRSRGGRGGGRRRRRPPCLVREEVGRGAAEVTVSAAMRRIRPPRAVHRVGEAAPDPPPPMWGGACRGRGRDPQRLDMEDEEVGCGGRQGDGAGRHPPDLSSTHRPLGRSGQIRHPHHGGGVAKVAARRGRSPRT